MKVTLDRYKTAIRKAAKHAREWNDKAESTCMIKFKCPKTGFQ